MASETTERPKSKSTPIKTLLLLVVTAGYYAIQQFTGGSAESGAGRGGTAVLGHETEVRPAPGSGQTGTTPRKPAPAGDSYSAPTDASTRSNALRSDIAVQGAAKIANAFTDETSDLQVESLGMVDRVLPDDDEGSRHQRFILRLADGATLLVAHNIDLAERLPLEKGDIVHFLGEYEWGEKGGTLHWTHRNPARNPRHPHGWLRHKGQLYE